MYNHAPENYVCPFCLIAQGVENEHVYTQQREVIYRDELVTAFVASHWWPNNPGHVLIVPNAHYENIFDLPLELTLPIQQLTKKIAFAFKRAYNCDGVSTRQHNEPAGSQDVWHYHLHVFPRYTDDDLYKESGKFAPPEKRLAYAQRLQQFLFYK